jgi:hypothetical protein
MDNQTTNDKITDYKQQLDNINRLLDSLRNQIETEQKEQPPGDAMLFRSHVHQEGDSIIVQEKTKGKKKKKESFKSRLKWLKKEFEHLKKQDKLEDEGIDSGEIAKIGSAVKRAKKAVGAFRKKKNTTEFALDCAQIKLVAYRLKMHEKPIAFDLQLKSAIQEIKLFEEYIEKMEVKLEHKLGRAN